ncbi:MAG: hypothetical protein PUF12_04365 [Thermoflexaceae bacterium]|nr:hypothetical protein [Thermoflexaceae bacterium]
MRQSIKEIFGQIKMSEECVQRITYAIQKEGQTSESGKRFPMKKYIAKPVLLFAAVCAILLAVKSATYTYAYVEKRWFSYNNKAEFTNETDDDGMLHAYASYDTSDTDAPAEYIDGRIYFTVNGENRDITDDISETRPYTYSFIDEESVTHYFIIGGTPEHFGYAEFLWSEDEHWIGGYVHGSDNGDGKEDAWFVNGKEALGIPWY